MRPLIAAALALGCHPTALRALPDDATVSLPADHAPHHDAQTEWWHVHASLVAEGTGEPLDVFAGFVVERTGRDRVAGLPVHPFVDPFHVAYVQIVTPQGAWSADRAAFPDVFAARFVGDGLDLRHGRWRVAWEEGVAVLSVRAGPHKVDLVLEPTAPATLPGAAGRVELVPGSAHQWVQLERASVRGRWQQGRETRFVTGTGFFKHQWGRLYDDALDGFEWISLDLDADHSLSVAWLLADGSRGVAGSRAWVTGPDGVPTELPADAVQVEPERFWQSRRSGNRWPTEWRVTGPELDLRVRARRDDLEVWAFPAALYAGPADAAGLFAGAPVAVPAYVEQAGARSPHFRFLFRSLPPEAP